MVSRFGGSPLLLVLCWCFSLLIQGAFSLEHNTQDAAAQQRQRVEQDSTASSLLASRAGALRGRRAALDESLATKAQETSSTRVVGPGEWQWNCRFVTPYTGRCSSHADCRNCPDPSGMERMCVNGQCMSVKLAAEGSLCTEPESLPGFYLTDNVPVFCTWGTSCVRDGTFAFCTRPERPGTLGAPCGPSFPWSNGWTKQACESRFTCSFNDVCVER